MQTKSKVVIALAVALLWGLAVPASAQLSGALDTSDQNGAVVNGNIYPSNDAVFLNFVQSGPEACLFDTPY